MDTAELGPSLILLGSFLFIFAGVSAVVCLAIAAVIYVRQLWKLIMVPFDVNSERAWEWRK